MAHETINNIYEFGTTYTIEVYGGHKKFHKLSQNEDFYTADACKAFLNPNVDIYDYVQEKYEQKYKIRSSECHYIYDAMDAIVNILDIASYIFEDGRPEDAVEFLSDNGIEWDEELEKLFDEFFWGE